MWELTDIEDSKTVSVSGEQGRGTASNKNSHKDIATGFAVSQKAMQLADHSPNPCRNRETESDRKWQW